MEVERIQMVLALVEQQGCQTNALVGYFGEERVEPCGHCTFCVTRQAQPLPPPRDLPPLPAGLNVGTFRALRKANPEALGDPRQAARFLCGLTSPAVTRAKLSRHEMFGIIEERRFSDVLEWCEETGI